MNRPVAVLDACALIPIRLATTLLWLAEAGLFQPLWSEAILDEVRRNLPRVGVTPDDADRRTRMMSEAFGAEAFVEGFDGLIDEMACDPKDRHVLAAAVHGGADVIVTFNLKDFPDRATVVHEIDVLHPDDFLVDLLAVHADTVTAALAAETAAFTRPPETVTAFLASLTATVPMFANLAADALVDAPGPVAPFPALVSSDDEAGIAAFGEPGDLTDPAQVALGWWTGLVGDVELARELTYDPRAWGDYARAVDHLAGRSLASRVLRAVDAPDKIAFMRFVEEVGSTARVFEAYAARMTFVTLVRVEDGTWRVWGLGPRLPAARDVLTP